MDFIRNILIVGQDISEVELIKTELEVTSPKLKVHGLTSRKQLSEASSKFEVSCVYLNTNMGRSDSQFILRFLSMLRNEKKSDVAIFISDDDFELAGELLIQFPSDNLVVINKPLDLANLIDKIQFKVFGKVLDPNAFLNAKNDLEIDLEFINVFITQTKAVLIEMSSAENLVHSAPVFLSKYQGPLQIDISSRIRISSDFFRGSYYLAFPKDTFLNFYEKIVLEKCTKIDSQNKDLAGELANIIYGKCKKKFSSEGLNLEMVIPSIHLGKIDSTVVVLIPFNCSLGPFFIAVAPGQI